MKLFRLEFCSLLLFAAPLSSFPQTNSPFNGRPWNLSSGNLSVAYIQASPIGAFPRTNFFEPPPSLESQVHLKNLGLVANEDYIAWGAVEREPGQWIWQQHDAMEKRLHEAGLKYVVYDWVHFPPVWLRDHQTNNRTLMRCLEHGKEANYLSVFDPRTIEWYDHFFKNLHDHFGDKIDDVYACILGPYGEGNYPLMVPDWVNMGHCHEGYWCGDPSAIKAFQSALKTEYNRISRLNKAWGTQHHSFDEIQPPREISDPKFKPSPAAFPAAQDKRRWLDFITWYHQAIIDFAEKSARAALKYFPAEKVRMKPGGSAGGVNPIPWGTYCPGYAKMAGPLHVLLQPADCQGAVFADKWMGTAYQFYGVKECTEPAGNLDAKAFVRRMFSDASAGAAQLFSYQFEEHAANIQKYVHLFTGKSGDTEIAVYSPTTLYRLGENLQPTIKASAALRDLCEFDVLDELLIADGALTTKRYKALILFQAETVDQPILNKMASFLRHGGKIIAVGNLSIKNVEGQPWPSSSKLKHLPLPKGAGRGEGESDVHQPASSNLGKGSHKNQNWLPDLSSQLAGLKGVDGQVDGLWTCRRGKQVFLFNSTTNTIETKPDGKPITVPAYTIWNGP